MESQTQINPIIVRSVIMLSALLLLTIIGLVNLLVLVNFLFQDALPPYILIVAIVMAIILNLLLLRPFGLDKKSFTISVVTSLLLILLALLASWFYFDLSWDGQWYQQAAVYDLAGGWNPLASPLITPDHTDNTSILHFPKNIWYFGAAVLRFTGSIEMGKAYNLMVLFAAIGAVYSFCRELDFSNLRALILTSLVVLNPVVWSELTTYLNDGDLYLLLVIYLAAIISWLRSGKLIYMAIGVISVCSLINLKFTGLIFFVIASLFVFIYVILRQKDRWKRFFLAHLLAIVLGILVFGYNPYVTNFINRGQPLYPLMGSKAYPSVFANGKDDNDTYETPQNMRGKSLPVRLFYANFSEPGNAPYNHEDGAKLSIPFATNIKSWTAYQFHETRLSGFGPYFGASLLIALLSLAATLFTNPRSRLPILLFVAGLCCCLSLSRHFWWPRFFPILWLIPLIPLLFAWKPGTENRKGHLIKSTLCWATVLIMCVNAMIVAAVHLTWETKNSIKLRSDLQRLRDDKRAIEVRYDHFKTSVTEKLKYWGINYKTVKLKKKDTTVSKLPSVVEGYPNQVLYRQK